MRTRRLMFATMSSILLCGPSHAVTQIEDSHFGAYL